MQMHGQMHSQMHPTLTLFYDTMKRQMQKNEKLGKGVQLYALTKGDVRMKSKSNPNPTFNRHTAGTPLPTVENIVHPRNGKLSDKSKTNRILT